LPILRRMKNPTSSWLPQPRSYLFLLLAFLIVSGVWAQLPGQKLVADQTAYYPRVIRLQTDNHTPKRLLASFDRGNTGSFYESMDDGATWSTSSVGTVTETTPPRTCCSGFYEVSATLGSTEAGTLFWATSVGTDQKPRTDCSIRLYKSTDKARTWSYFSTIVSGKTGLWEPEFTVDQQGRLLCYYSSEEYKNQGFNQLIAHKTSVDGGQTWTTEVTDVAMTGGVLRPGMPIIRRLSDRSYVMSYELCGAGCDAYVKFSKDGHQWGSASEKGTRIESTNGNHFAHAPTISWASDGSATGKLLAIGQVLHRNSDNSTPPSNGKVYMVNSNKGLGAWTEMAAPVWSPNQGTDPCPNYSSQLLVSADGKNVLEIALAKNTSGRCRPYVNTIPLNSPVAEHMLTQNTDTPAQTFTNPLLPDGADPWVIFNNGYYYYTNTTGQNLTLWRTKDFTNLAQAEKKVVWTPPASGPNSRDIWAPELHQLNKKWYLYYTATDKAKPGDLNRYVFVLENESANPIEGNWTDKGKVNTNYTGLDGSVFEHNGKVYFLYSGYVGPQSNLFIAEMINPWTISKKQVELTRPTYAWEKYDGREICEGPQFLRGKNGRLHIIYSASACWDDNYSLGMLTSNETSDLLDPASWKKSATPVFSKSVENRVFGPGHNCFTKSPNGQEDWIIYHAKDQANGECKNRTPRAQPFFWKPDGSPDFGIPVASGKEVSKPN
jgi:GH43 family beta-xylosidase